MLSNMVPALLRRFLKDTAGTYAITFSLMVVPVLGTVALAVDYSNLSKQKGYVQNSLDAAALATSKEYAAGNFASSTAAQEKALMDAYASDFFHANLPAEVKPEDVVLTTGFTTVAKQDEDGIWRDEKAVALSASLTYDTLIAKIVGHETIVSQIASEVAMGNLTVEVALVVDNSGSMASNSKITRLQEASRSMVDKIFSAAATSNKPNPISFSVVPFAASVNIGSDNADKPWMDINGWAPIHHENLDWSTYIKPSNATVEIIDRGTHKTVREKIGNGAWDWKTRHDIHEMLDTEWSGCVEMRPWPHSTLDTVQSVNGVTFEQAQAATSGDGLDALFVPMFAPSEPSSTYVTKSGNKWVNNNDSYNYPNDYTYDYRKKDDVIFASTSADRTSNQNVRQNWIWRYQNSKVSMTTSRNPNISCTTPPITPLTTDKPTIKTAIDNLVANGNTNVQEGVAWGWRTLSAAEPFTGGRAYDNIDNRKYIIVLTDGNNTYSTSSTPNKTTYGAWGYGKHDRIEAGLAQADRPALYKNTTPSSWESKMNVHTLQTCENAKAAGITIFSIAFDVSSGSSVKKLLELCGGSAKDADGLNVYNAGKFYYDVGTTELAQAMDDIAAQISEMRIKR